MSRAAMDRAEFERALRDKGRYYHIHHPFHVAMYEGRASREQIQGWVANRFYYQVNIPLKDAAILANCPDREVRREWIQRILDHDGAPGEAGGIEPGCVWRKRWAWSASRCCPRSGCCPACASPSTPTSTSPVAPVGRRRRAVR